MGSRFKSKGVIVRELEDSVIVFWSSYTIYVKDMRGRVPGWTIFHRYYTPKGFYKSHWRDFRRKMLRTIHLPIERCCNYADKYQVLHYCTIREIDLNQVKVIKRG